MLRLGCLGRQGRGWRQRDAAPLLSPLGLLTLLVHALAPGDREG